MSFATGNRIVSKHGKGEVSRATHHIRDALRRDGQNANKKGDGGERATHYGEVVELSPKVPPGRVSFQAAL